MTEIPYVMLARGDGVVELIVVAVFIAISIIGAVLQKAAKEREVKRKQEEQAGHPDTSAPAKRRRYKPLDEATRTVDRAGSGRRQQAAQQLQSAQQGPVVQSPTAAGPSSRQQITAVEAEVLEQRRRLAKRQAERRRRLAARKSPEADTEAIESRLIHAVPIAAAAAETLPSGAGMKETLASAERARAAIIFHEIFSCPKALRRGPEMWEL